MGYNQILNKHTGKGRFVNNHLNKIQQYFPHVEKLLPLIGFFRNTLIFSERVIQKLCKLKKVKLKGDSYSHEFNRKFRDKNADLSFEKDKDSTTYVRMIFHLFNSSDRKRMNGDMVWKLLLQDRING